MSHLHTTVAVRSQEVLTLSCYIIPLPLEQVNHAIPAALIVVPILRVDQRQEGNGNQCFAQKHLYTSIESSSTLSSLKTLAGLLYVAHLQQVKHSFENS